MQQRLKISRNIYYSTCNLFACAWQFWTWSSKYNNKATTWLYSDLAKILYRAHMNHVLLLHLCLIKLPARINCARDCSTRGWSVRFNMYEALITSLSSFVNEVYGLQCIIYMSIVNMKGMSCDWKAIPCSRWTWQGARRGIWMLLFDYICTTFQFL